MLNLKNKVSIVINDEAMTNIQKGLAMIQANLPGLITLSPEERHDMAKMGDKTKAFVSKSLDYAKQNPHVVPKYLSVEDFANDVEAYNKIFQVLAPFQKLTEELDDTMLLAGSEAFSASLAFYSALKTAISAGEIGLKGIYDDLSARFPGRPGRKKENAKA